MVVAALRGVTGFASNTALTAEQVRSAPVRSYPRPEALRDPVELPGAAGKALAGLGIETVADLVEHLPHSHRDRREVRRVADLAMGQDATVAVTVRSVSVRPMRDRRRKRVEARAGDESGPLVAVWFNQPWIARQLPEGSHVLLHGRLRRRGEFWVSEHEPLGGEAPVHTVGLVPVHPATEGLSAGRLRSLVWDARGRFLQVPEPLPARLRVSEALPERPAALSAVHFPDSEDDERGARRRLAFEELFLLQLAVAGRRRARREGRLARSLEPRGVVVDRWRWSLPFELTADQRRAMKEIDDDLRGERPMQRLLMGEVGAGKTVVALHAMLRAVENGAQAALMAPTETLAEQHHRTLDRLLGGALPLELLTGSTPAARRRELLGSLASGALPLVVGTHALIEETVEFRDLAVAVVDEQHRFGVRQRAALDSKAPEGLAPHALHMTATPIPRTLSLTAYGDLDATALRELPAGRRPVETFVVDGARARRRAYERIREEIAAGRQCFVVCPLVEESEALQAKAATAEYERLRATEFRDQRVELIHGQLPSKAKQAAMEAFASGDADVLVATSVVEVGIDVPNATVMLIEAAERYGLSQLHQLRGRVGRAGHESLCILFGDAKLPRLDAIAGEDDGFRLAEVDLELRGAGDVLGTRQHGLPELRVARLPEDTELLARARDHADDLLRADPELTEPEHALLRDAVAARFGSELDPIPA
ncbi:MAG TPA: ATP-dependent DNA helicase RecG [Thermoleophilaceae bacterium]|nr:ATP-dependent DNA helicase RecG [Thermoleophilaceae bacterium]